ncbi:DENN domain-containing protein 1B-like isoform X2 [Ischnura elegans]|uniref:DENN domain-containing protein 1B-like isoform X2 n=1 Tax=Ischnura elegans TaxID=197161 RepID=UPI001ED883E3|nr:DENN domain-containing protein 1B-like isoform X2 [Ischnura elegans]
MMGSRIRENVTHLFECFCEVVGPQPPDKESWVIRKFPDSYKDEEVLKSVPKFVYPCEFQNNSVQHFSFVLTSIDSKWTFGFCRHDSKTETAIVVLSYLPWHETFYKLLNHIADLTHNSEHGDLWNFLSNVYHSHPPEPGAPLQIPFNNGLNTFVCQCPDLFRLPSIPQNRNLTEYYNAVDGHNMMIVFASMLYERRIIFTSSKLYRLSACVQAANAIIYPMNWQHIFIPVLPLALMDYLLAPMPYLIGVPEPILKRARMSDLGDVVILDADNNKVTTPFQDLESFPPDVVSSLRRQLRNRAALIGDGISRAFLRTLVQLIGGYRDALHFHQGEKISFNAEAFVESRPANMKPFLRKMLQLQIFQQFIEERLDMLNAGLGFSDEFELEACNYSDKSSSKLKQQYKEWTYTMRREGSAFFKSVKSKANPAMKSAVKTVKERGKEVKERSRSAYKGIRSKLRDIQSVRGEGGMGDLDSGRFESEVAVGSQREIVGPPKPSSAPSSPTRTPRRPRTIASTSKACITASASYRRDSDLMRKNSSDSGPMNYSPSSDPGSPKAGSNVDYPPLQMSPLDMDLMGDLQDVIFRKCSIFGEDIAPSPPVNRMLKPVRSLEGRICDSWWSNATMTTPSLSPPSPSPILLSPTPIPAQYIPVYSSPSKNPFMSSPWNGGGDSGTLSLGSAHPMGFGRIPPPIVSRRYIPSGARIGKENLKEESKDLIRLNSTPSEDDFDPLKAKSSTASAPTQQPSAGPSFFGNGYPSSPNGANAPGSPNKTVNNPIYPYFEPRSQNSSLAPQNSFLYSASYRHSQDLDGRDSDLLREYGIDFNSMSMANGFQGTQEVSSADQGGKITDPFEDLVRFDEPSSKKDPKKEWTTFE